MIHSSTTSPRVFAYKGTLAFGQIDRLQELTFSATLNRTKIQEIGRDGTVCWRKSIPTINGTARQLEYGNLAFWKQLANKATATTKVEWTDFESSAVDIAVYETDENNAFKSTVWYPNLRTAGFALNIGSPEGQAERSFTFIGEDEITFQGDNKYLIVLQDSLAAAPAHTIVLNATTYANYPLPTANPDESGSASYIEKVVKVTSGGIASTLTSADYSYNAGTNTLTITNSAAGDTYKVYYTADTYITNQDLFTNNDADLCVLPAENCSIYLKTTNYVYRLQSVACDVTFDRYDVKEIGSTDVVLRGVRDTNVRITLGRILDQWTVEEVYRGVAPGYGRIDIRDFDDNINLIIKLYSTDAKDTFSIGYAFTGLSPASLDNGVALNDYIKRGSVLQGEEGFVTSVESDLTL